MSVYSGIMSQYSSNDVAALADGFNWKHSYPCISKQKENYSKYVCVCVCVWLCVCVCVYVRTRERREQRERGVYKSEF